MDIKFKILTQADERDIDAEMKAMKKVSNQHGDKEITTRMKKILLEVDGKSDQAFINKFVDTSFLAMDSLALREHLNVFSPDIDMKHLFECSLCGHSEEITVPMTVRFFWPSARV